MQYEDFSRHLRKKYSTRLHIADQLIDQLKYNNRSSLIASEFNNKKVLEPYFNECILAAERIKNNRRSERDRQICYENLILAEKLERIKSSSGQNIRENFEKNHEQDAIKSIHKNFIAKQSLLFNKKKKLVETLMSSYHSPSLSQSETALSENEDDQATAADVDASIDSTFPTSYKTNNRNINCVKSKSRKYKEIYFSKNENEKFFQMENNRLYQHLNNIDMTMIRDTMPLSTPKTSKHFSICILPHFDSDIVKSKDNHSKFYSHNRPCAFKKEILYH